MKQLPTINLIYWALLVSATTIGETMGDLISTSFHLGYANSSLVLIMLFVLFLLIELFSNIQNSLLYWAVITTASTAGTTISDYISRTLLLGYSLSCVMIIFPLLVVFGVLYLLKSGSFSNQVVSKKIEFFYWMALLISSTFGTAIGDLIANETVLGFSGGTLFLIIILALIALMTKFSKVSKITCFWLAMITIHPIGATLGDYITKPDGLNLGNLLATVLLLFIFILLFAGSNVKATQLKKDIS